MICNLFKLALIEKWCDRKELNMADSVKKILLVEDDRQLSDLVTDF